MEVCGIQTRQQKVAPVEGRDVVQRRHDIVEPVGLDGGRRAGRAVKPLAEIVERTHAAAQFANLRVRVEPDQPAFIIKVDTAAQRIPFSGRAVKNLGRDRGVDQRTPQTPGLVIEICGDLSKVPAILLRRPQTAASRKQIAEILRQPFINPEQLTLHRLLVIRRRQSCGPAELAIP